jgi:Fe-S-cluster containining protein
MTTSRLRPLLTRSGARYQCFGDGVCCTSIHALGPVSSVERKALEILKPAVVVRHDSLPMWTMRSTSQGQCTFLEGSVCRLHEEHGSDAKPATCRRFPFGLVATPLGGRITTAHRCPCRTMGDRPALTPKAAEVSLRTGGRLQCDFRAPHRIRLRKGSVVSFRAYAQRESRLLAELQGEEPLDQVFRNWGAVEGDPLPDLECLEWLDVATHYRQLVDGTASGEALGWFGDGLLHLLGEARLRRRNRPWSAGFERAELRSVAGASARAIWGDWAADTVWSLAWTQDGGSLVRAVTDLALRWTVGFCVARSLQGLGVREDRAAAEAILIVESGAAVPMWHEVVRNLPSSSEG